MPIPISRKQHAWPMTLTLVEISVQAADQVSADALTYLFV